MPTIVHFEIPADDLERAKKFYGDLFGWKIEKVAGPMEYWMISTTDEAGNKAVGGGMMARQHPQQTITNYIDVPSVDEHAAKVEQAGGKVVVPKTPVPGFGYFAVCLDPENNAFALWENDADAKPGPPAGD
jgi:predicted enzyme related to lactoylglutathione lyase